MKVEEVVQMIAEKYSFKENFEFYYDRHEYQGNGMVSVKIYGSCGRTDIQMEIKEVSKLLTIFLVLGIEI